MPKDDKKVRNIHDRRYVKPTETSIPASPIRLSTKEAEELAALNKTLMDVRGALADACMEAGVVKAEIERLEGVLEKQNSLVSTRETEAIKVRGEYVTTLDKIAREHGIQVGDKSGGVWKHSVADGTLVRVDQVSQPSSTPSTPSPEN